MLRFRRILAVLLLALWLPATLHCDLEAAGVRNVLGCHDHAADVPSPCAEGACHSIEGLSYKLDAGALKAPPPALALLEIFRTALECAPTAAEASPPPARPPAVAQSWHLLQRTAPAPRAPTTGV